MKTLGPFLAGFLLLSSSICLANTASNLETLLIEGEVNGVFELFVDSSPTPYCGTGPWDAVLGQGDNYSFCGGFDEEPCTSSWSIHCSGDSLGFQGSWTTENPTAYYWNFSFVNCEISAQLSFSQDVAIHVLSESEGVLESDSHLVTITPENGDEIVLMGPEPGSSADLNLPAGIYTISMIVGVIEHHTHHDYQSNLKIWWDVQSGVQTDQATLSGIKALYR